MRDLSLGELLTLPGILLTGCGMIVGVLGWYAWYVVRYRWLRWFRLRVLLELAGRMNALADRLEAVLERLRVIAEGNEDALREARDLCRQLTER